MFQNASTLPKNQKMILDFLKTFDISEILSYLNFKNAKYSIIDLSYIISSSLNSVVNSTDGSVDIERNIIHTELLVDGILFKCKKSIETGIIIDLRIYCIPVWYKIY